MPDNDQSEITLDWREVTEAAARRQDRAGDGKRRSPRASAKMIAFPAGRRVGEIRRLAEQMRKLSCERGELHLQLQLRTKAKTLRRRGFQDQVVRRQISSLEAAVRTELWRREFGSADWREDPQR